MVIEMDLNLSADISVRKEEKQDPVWIEGEREGEGEGTKEEGNTNTCKVWML